MARRLYRDKEWLETRYLGDRLSPRKIAVLCGASATAVSNWLVRHEIPTRSMGEAAFADRGHSLAVSPWMHRFIDGEMLGDGSMWSYNEFSGNYRHTNKHKGYLEWLRDVFSQEHIECGPIHSGVVQAPAGKPAERFLIATWFYDFLKQEHTRWYPNGVRRKAVPADLVIDPIVLRQWYLGDGWLGSSNGGKSPAPSLAVNGFAEEERSHLCDLLIALGFDLGLQQHRTTIRIKTRSTAKFFEFIGPCPRRVRDIYGYKWACGMTKKQWLASRTVA